MWRRHLETAAVIAALIAVTLFSMLGHALWSYPDAAEASRLRQANQHLTQVLDTLEGQLPELRRTALRSELTFSQLWVRSGLGVEPRLLAVGPHQQADTDPFAPEAVGSLSGNVLQLDPVELPLEIERISEDGRLQHQALADLLEYFHDAERLLSHTPSLNPAHTPWFTSSFGKRRDPMHGAFLMHKGLDLGGPVGSEILAPADGVVIFTGPRGGYGKTVVIAHGYGLQTHFAHLSRFRVDKGERVRRGDVIAEMGSTGKSTGPHLHYEVRRSGQPLDPRRFILD
ncbi:MAG: M23 family metallopeptidase [Deltaproteobacteria bacterium]|nr:M23 family metallopeptidase [Deltaproteobacteria bacterium]